MGGATPKLGKEKQDNSLSDLAELCRGIGRLSCPLYRFKQPVGFAIAAGGENAAQP